jgi:hypothetical protein
LSQCLNEDSIIRHEPRILKLAFEPLELHENPTSDLRRVALGN